MEVEEEESLLQSIRQLLLTPPDDDDDDYRMDDIEDIGHVGIAEEETVVEGNDDDNSSVENESNVSIIHVHDGIVLVDVLLMSLFSIRKLI